jgi:hypothetical protein
MDVVVGGDEQIGRERSGCREEAKLRRAGRGGMAAVGDPASWLSAMRYAVRGFDCTRYDVGVV